MRGLAELALVWRQLGVEQQLGHAEHAVHRRADLVAHVGEELRFGAVGSLRLAGQSLGLLGALSQLEGPLQNLCFESALVMLDAVAVLAQPLEHHAEAGAEFTDLVVCRDGHLAVELAAGDLAGQRGELPDRTRGPAGDRERQHDAARGEQ